MTAAQTSAQTSPHVWLSPPDMGPQEREALLTAFDSNWVAPAGPDLPAFEQEVAEVVGAAHAVATSSGTAALHLCLQLAGVGPGDTVLVPSFTFAASANPVVHLGAEPVFVDSDPTTWTIDPYLVAEELASSVRRGRPPAALVAVDIYGQCADYDPLRRFCAEYGVVLIEDAAEALGSTYRGRMAGSFGDSAVVSFNGNKIITTGGGGMLLTGQAGTAHRARYLATQARDPVPHYEHREAGYNFRLSNLLAAIGRAQLRSLGRRVATRRGHYAFYAEAFAGVPGLSMMPMAGYGTSNCWLSCVLVDAPEFGATPEQIRLRLEELGIEARPTWKPMHRQPVFADRRVVGGRVSDDLFARGLSLPSGSALTPAERDRVVEGVLSLAGRGTRRVIA